MWQSFEIKGSEESLDHALPGLVGQLYQHSDRNVSVDCFFFIRNRNNKSTLHVSSEKKASRPVAEYLESCSGTRGVQITPGPCWMPAIPLSRAARKLIERFAHHSSRQSLYLLTRPKAERLARMCFFDALLAYHFLRSESAVKEFFGEHACAIEEQAALLHRTTALETRDRVYRPLRALFHFLRTRKKPLAPRLEAWNRICKEIADGFLVMALNNELIFEESLEPGAGMKRMLRYLIEEHHARLCYSEEDKAAIARGISGMS